MYRAVSPHNAERSGPKCLSTRSERRTPALGGHTGVCTPVTIDSWSPGFKCVPRPVVFGEHLLGGGGWDGDGGKKGPGGALGIVDKSKGSSKKSWKGREG